MDMKISRFVALAITFVTGGAVLAQHAGDVWVARTSGGALVVSQRGYVPDASYFELPPSGGFLPGWSDAEPGFDKAVLAAPEMDEYPLATGHDVWLEVVHVDAAFRGIVLGEGPGGSPLYLRNPGDSFELSQPSGVLHEHPVFHINSADPAFDSEQCVWHATFRLRDEGSTNYADSAAFTLRFANVAVRYQTDPLEDATGDFDENGATNAADLPAFAECLAGVNATPAPDDPAITTCEVECLNAFDFDNDLDVDLADYAALQRAVHP
jgi:hypothetical protein